MLLEPFVRGSYFIAALKLSISSHFWSSFLGLRVFVKWCLPGIFHLSLPNRVSLVSYCAIFPELSNSFRGWSVMATSLIGVLCLPECAFEALWLPLFDDNFSSLFLLEGISANFNLLCKLAVSQLAVIFVVFCVNLVNGLSYWICSALWFSCIMLTDTGIVYWYLYQTTLFGVLKDCVMMMIE